MDRQQKGQVTTQAGSNESRRTIGTGNIREKTKKGKATYRGQAKQQKATKRTGTEGGRPQP
jgi:hypothetical protein